MFNKKDANGINLNASGSGNAPAAPPQMRKPTGIAPLPPKRQEAGAAPTVPANAKNSLPTNGSNATFIGRDLLITGSIVSSGEIIIEGTVEGDVRAQKIVIKNKANISGELISEELIIHGRVSGIVRGVKILLASDCILNGDILHETLSIESGAQFEGGCKRSDDPLGLKKNGKDNQNKATIKPLAGTEDTQLQE